MHLFSMSLRWSLLAVMIVTFMPVTKADCGDPPSIPNAYNNITGTSPFPQGTSLRYDCELGFNPAGTSRYFSCTDSTWTNGNFWCDQIYCSYIETPENGQVTNSPQYEVGTIIQFACNEGYVMSGNDRLLCRINGEWSPSIPPICTAQNCGEFGSIQHAELFQDSSYTERNHYGSIVEVTCLDDRTLIGPSQVRCQADGTWGLRPTCEYVQCPPFPNLNSPCISSIDYLGTFLFISCTDNISTHFGPAYADCRSGQWTTTEMGCLCACLLPRFNSSLLTFRNVNSHGFLPHATALTWTCHTGQSKAPNLDVICIDGKLKARENGMDIIIANNSNPIEMDEILLALCILPTTVTSSSRNTASTVSITVTSSSRNTMTTNVSTSMIPATSLRSTSSSITILSVTKSSNYIISEAGNEAASTPMNISHIELNSDAVCLRFAQCLYILYFNQLLKRL